MKHYFTPSTIILCLVFVLGLVFTFFVPPFQKPDENRHYYQSAALASGNFYCQTNEQGIYLDLKESRYRFPHVLKYDEIAHTPNYKFFLSQFGWYQIMDSPTLKIHEWCSWSFVGYIIPALGIWIAQFTHSLMIEFYFARLLSFLFFFLCLKISLKLASPRSLPWLYFFALLPMTLHQASAISYDSLQLSLIMLIFAFMTKFVGAMSSELTQKSRLTFIIILFLFVLAKPASIFFYLLIFLIPGLKTGQKLLALMLCLILTLPFSRPLFYPGVEGGVDPTLQFNVIMRDPLHYLSILSSSIANDSSEIMRGVIGYFGWLDYELPFWVYLIYLLSFGALVVHSDRFKPSWSLTQILLIALLLLSYYLGTYTTLYLTWSPVASPVVKGVQGRYFLVILPFLGLWLSQLLSYLFSTRLRQCLLLCLVALGLVGVVLKQIYLRYYDYSSYGISPLVLPLTLTAQTPLLSASYPLDLVGSAKGVGFYFRLSSNPSTNLVYRYVIKTDNCQTDFQIGYFSLPSPNGDLTHLVTTKPYPLNYDSTCVAIEPIMSGSEALVVPLANGHLIDPVYLIPSLNP